jgi:hypothetical protein
MIELRNCRFKFDCPKRWDGLERTDKANVRYCDHCKEDVHFCDTTRELRDAIEKNLCVAISTSAADPTPEKLDNVAAALKKWRNRRTPI